MPQSIFNIQVMFICILHFVSDSIGPMHEPRSSILKRFISKVWDILEAEESGNAKAGSVGHQENNTSPLRP